MADVREHLQRYHLTLETRPRHGMKLFGGEMAIRACLTDLLWTLAQQEPSHPLIVSTTLNTEVSQRLQSLLPDIFSHCQIRLTDESELFLRLYCAVAVRRIREGIRYRNAWQRRSMKRCAMRRMRLRSYYNSWPTSRCRSRK